MVHLGGVKRFLTKSMKICVLSQNLSFFLPFQLSMVVLGHMGWNMLHFGAKRREISGPSQKVLVRLADPPPPQAVRPPGWARPGRAGLGCKAASNHVHQTSANSWHHPNLNPNLTSLTLPKAGHNMHHQKTRHKKKGKVHVKSFRSFLGCTLSGGEDILH